MEAVSPRVAIEEQNRPVWPIFWRFLFRFFCCYWSLFILADVDLVRQRIVPWVAIQLFHVTGPAAIYRRSGSGDTTLAYIQVLLFLVVALTAAIAWSSLDRRRTHYRKLHAWLNLLIRYSLAFVLIGYGFAKLGPGQFPPNSLQRLMQPFGDFSPMGVLWSFMGTSPSYTLWAGTMEILAGILLLFRRTTLLGALVSCGLMLNIVALNLCYDVPVKLYSSHLLLMAIFLLAPSWRRLIDVFVLNRATVAADLSAPHFDRRWLRVAATTLWVLLVGSRLTSGVIYSYRQHRTPPARSPLYGMYVAVSGAPDGWHRIVFDQPNFVVIRMTNGTLKSFAANYDLARNTLTLDREARVASLNWILPETGRLVLTGTFDSVPVSISLRRIDGDLMLNRRGFHWITEVPFNR